MAADTRATGGNIVGDKNCEKIHNLAPNIFCCGAGTAADCDHVTGTINQILIIIRNDQETIGVTQIEHSHRVKSSNGCTETS